MKIDIKYYKTKKTKDYIKKNNLFLILNGINKNSADWIKTEQDLKKISFSYYKVFNKIAVKVLNDSKYKKTLTTINSSTFFMKPDSTVLTKQIMLNSFESLLFSILAIKLSNKIYSLNQLKKIHSLKYKKNKLLLYQFAVVHSKCYCT